MPETTWIASNTVDAPGKADLALAWIKKNRETFIGSLVILLAAVVFGVYFFMHYRDLREAAWKNLFIAQQTGYGGNTQQAQQMLTDIETNYRGSSASAYATLTKGDMLFTRGSFKEAEAEYAKLLTASPEMAPFALYSLGKAKEASGDLAGAQAQYSDMLSKYPEHFMTPEAHYSLARTLELSGAAEPAKAAYEKIVLLYPDTAWAGQAKARLTAADKKAPPAK